MIQRLIVSAAKAVLHFVAALVSALLYVLLVTPVSRVRGAVKRSRGAKPAGRAEWEAGARRSSPWGSAVAVPGEK